MAELAWLAVMMVGVMTAVACAAAVSRKWSPIPRVGLAFLAALAAFAIMPSLGVVIGPTRSRTNEALTWTRIRQSYSETTPALGSIMTLNPAVENEFKTALMPVFIDRSGKSPADMGAAAVNAIANVMEKHVFPVAAHGSTATVNAWGSFFAPMTRELAAISTEVCAEYALTNFARYGDNKKAAAMAEASYRALIDAYKTSDSAKYPLPDEDAVRAQYAEAQRIAQPPFNEEDDEALDTFDKQSQERQCSLMLRLSDAIDRLEPSRKAMIYRRLMKGTN